MAVSRLDHNSMRLVEPLVLWALGISIALHLIGYGGFELGHRYGWWKKDLMPAWLKTKAQHVAEIQKIQQNQPPPLLFVETDPTAAPVEAPKDAKYYSSHNSRASSEAATTDSIVPKINGQQTHVPQTKDGAQHPKSVPLQPTPPKPQTRPVETKAASKPIGDLAYAKTTPSPNEQQQQQPPEHVRPRKLSEVPGYQKMHQEGGDTHRASLQPSLDARATPFGEYDWKLIEVIRNHWWDLLDSRQFSRQHTGRVVVEFDLMANGHATNVKVASTEVDDLLTYICQSAILDTEPYDPWPTDMRRFLGADIRHVQFTFFYEPP